MVALPPDPTGRPPVGLRPPTREGTESAGDSEQNGFGARNHLKKKKTGNESLKPKPCGKRPHHLNKPTIIQVYINAVTLTFLKIAYSPIGKIYLPNKDFLSIYVAQALGLP